MLLAEMYDTKAQIKWSSNGPMTIGTLSLGNDVYIIQLYHVAPNDSMVGSHLTNAPRSKHSWYFAFGVIDDFGMPSDNLTGLGQSPSVIGAIVNGLIEFLSHHVVDNLYFGCHLHDMKVRKLYLSITRRLTMSHRWNLVGEEDISILGRPQHIFYVSKTK
jgi:hypothetical protein